MKKKIKLTESDIVKIVRKVIIEQHEESIQIRRIQRFLNRKYKLSLKEDGLMGTETKKAIMRYQSEIGVTPDGVWGFNTTSKMPQQDRRIF